MIRKKKLKILILGPNAKDSIIEAVVIGHLLDRPVDHSGNFFNGAIFILLTLFFPNGRYHHSREVRAKSNDAFRSKTSDI